MQTLPNHEECGHPSQGQVDTELPADSSDLVDAAADLEDSVAAEQSGDLACLKRFLIYIYSVFQKFCRHSVRHFPVVEMFERARIGNMRSPRHLMLRVTEVEMIKQQLLD